MATTKIRNAQIKDNTIELSKLVDNFLAGGNWDITGGAADATITGLAQGVNGSDAVNVDQLNAALAALSGAANLRGGLDGASDLTGNSTGNTYADGKDGYMQGDFFDITADGDLTVSDGTIEVKAGDSIKILNDVAADAAITLADVHKFDNTESADIVRSGNVIDDLTSTSATQVLSANQGRILDEKITELNQCETEEFDVAAADETFTLTNPPKAGLKNIQVHLNGLRISSSEYTVTGSDVVITSPTVEVGDCVIIDYRY